LDTQAREFAPKSGASVRAGPAALLEYSAERASLRAELIAGLRARPKRIQPLYFYDALGSRLFERICEQPEYALTRTELRILEHYAPAMGERIGPDARVVELGAGSARKIRLLLGGLPRPASYVPIDISREALLAAAAEVSRARPDLEVQPVCADFTGALRLPRPDRPHACTLAFFPGSTIGNFEERAAVELLQRVRELVGRGASLLIGTDLVKDARRLEAAYDDAAGVTRDFNLNVLRRLNREFDADFRLAGFRHEARWDAAASRIEMRLVSRTAQRVRIAATTIAFERDEALITEYSHKYTIPGFRRLALRAGWRADQTWTDDAQGFAVHLLRADSPMLVAQRSSQDGE
jgi:dimethylhistidine N-methyltransferase